MTSGANFVVLYLFIGNDGHPVFFQVHGYDDRDPVRVNRVRVHVRARFSKIGIELIGFKQFPVLDNVCNATDFITHDTAVIGAIEPLRSNLPQTNYGGWIPCPFVIPTANWLLPDLEGPTTMRNG